MLTKFNDIAFSRFETHSNGEKRCLMFAVLSNDTLLLPPFHLNWKIKKIKKKKGGEEQANGIEIKAEEGRK